MPPTSIQQILAAHTAAWMALPGVVGTAIGESEGRPCIKVFVKEKTPELAAQIPDSVEGHPVVVEQTGEFRAL